MGAHQKDMVDGFIHDEICHDIPHLKENSHSPATTTITLNRGQEMFATDCCTSYKTIRKGNPCK